MIIKNQTVLSLNTVGKIGHTFKYEDIENAVEEAILRSQRGSLFGELFIDGERQSNAGDAVDTTKVSHFVKNLRYNPTAKVLTADFEIINGTEAGKKLRKLLLTKDSNVRLCVSQRALSTDKGIDAIIAYDIINYEHATDSKNTEISKDNVIQKDI